nr:MAG TPA: hypothetical protein [Caudoviricetes sp.]
MTLSVWCKTKVLKGRYRISVLDNKIHVSLNVPDLDRSFDHVYDPHNLLLETRQWLCGDEYRKQRFKEMVNSLYRHRAGV